MKEQSAALATQVVHCGTSATIRGFVPSSLPIDNAVTYRSPSSTVLDAVLAGTASGYVYRRLGNTTVDSLQSALAQLEGTESALVCESGMAALHLALLAAGARSGVTVVAAKDLYGGTHALLADVFAAQGVKVVFADLTDLASASQLLQKSHASVIMAETISNPLLRVCDIRELTRLAQAHHARVIVDNTFATPVLYRPSVDGADYVVHSATKYLGGHGDILAGVVAASGEAFQAASDLQQTIGHVVDPTSAWLLLRSLRTLVIRMRQQCANALVVARFLRNHRRVARVYYPGLPSSPQYTVARRLFPQGMYGSIVSFEIDSAEQAEVFRFMDALELVAPVTSLGDVGTLLLYPWHSSHRSLSDESKLSMGIARGLVRLSVGIEDAADIVADLGRALDRV